MITGITIRETGEPGKGARFVMHLPKGTYRSVEKKVMKKKGTVEENEGKS